MIRKPQLFLFAFLVVAPGSMESADAQEPVGISSSSQPLIDDFNAATGKVRAIFLVAPT